MNKFVIPIAVVGLLGAGGAGYAIFAGGNPMDSARAAIAKGDVRTAQIELRNAVKSDPGNGEAHFRLGELQLSQNDPIAAEKELKLAQSLNYDPSVILPLLAQSYLAQGRFADVIEGVPAAGATPDQTARYLMLRSQAQIGLKDPAAAKATLDAAQQAAPRNVDVRLAQARLAGQMGDQPLAVRRADEALALDGARADAMTFKAQLMAAQGDRAGALALMDQAVTLDVNAMGPKLERANLLMNMGQDVKARADIDLVLKKEPRSIVALYLDAVLLVRAGKYAEADAQLTKLGPAINAFPRGLYFQAVTHANLGQVELAVEDATRYLQRAPGDAEGVRLLARIEVGAKRPARAIEILKGAVAKGMNDKDTLELLGQAYQAAGQPQAAAGVFEQAVDLAPKDPTVLTNLAASRMQLGDTSGATKALERSLDIQPAQPQAGEALVAAALASGDLDRAQLALDRLRKQVGDTEAVGVLTGLIKLARQDMAGGLQQFEAVVKQFPDSLEAKINLAKALILQSKRSEGEALLQQVLAKDPGNVSALNTLLQTLVQEGKLPEAVTAIEAARKARPRDDALTATQADLMTRSGQAPKALEMLNSARVDGQLSIPLQLAQARAQFASGALNDAKATYRSILLAQPTELEARRALTEILVNNKELKEAQDLLKDGLRTSPGNLGMMTTFVGLEQRLNGADAAVTAAEAFRKDPVNMPAASVLKGDVLMAAQRYTDAAAAYGTELKTTPLAALALRQALALAAAGSADQASDVLRTWLRANPGETDVAQLLATYDINAKRLPDAEQHLKTVLEKRPNDGQALNNLAWVYQQRGNGLARQTAQRAYLVAPSPESADTLGWIMVTDGKADQAIPLLKQAQAGRPDDRAIMYHLARAESDLGQKDEALTTIKSSLAGNTEFEERPDATKLFEQLSKK